MLDLEVSTRTPVAAPTALAPLTGSGPRPVPMTGTGQRRETLNFTTQKTALTGRVLGLGESVSDKVVMALALTAIAITLLTGLVASFLRAGSQGAADKATAQAQALQAQLAKGPLATALTHEKTVAKQFAALTGFLADATPWPIVLDGLAGLVPKGTKLSTITVDASKAVRIEGETGNQQDAATFMAALDASPLFETPRLDSLTLNESVDGSKVLFSIASRYTPQATPAVSTPAPTGAVGPDLQSATPAAPAPAANTTKATSAPPQSVAPASSPGPDSQSTAPASSPAVPVAPAPVVKVGR